MYPTILLRVTSYLRLFLVFSFPPTNKMNNAHSRQVEPPGLRGQKCLRLHFYFLQSLHQSRCQTEAARWLWQDSCQQLLHLQAEVSLSERGQTVSLSAVHTRAEWESTTISQSGREKVSNISAEEQLVQHPDHGGEQQCVHGSPSSHHHPPPALPDLPPARCGSQCVTDAVTAFPTNKISVIYAAVRILRDLE